MKSVTGTTQEDRESKRDNFSLAFLCLYQQGALGHFSLGNVNLGDEDFISKWYALLLKGKEKVDTLNFTPGDGKIPTGSNQCANCPNDALKDDFLCAECRDKASL